MAGRPAHPISVPLQVSDENIRALEQKGISPSQIAEIVVLVCQELGLSQGSRNLKYRPKVSHALYALQWQQDEVRRKEREKLKIAEKEQQRVEKYEAKTIFQKQNTLAHIQHRIDKMEAARKFALLPPEEQAEIIASRERLKTARLEKKRRNQECRKKQLAEMPNEERRIMIMAEMLRRIERNANRKKD